MVNICRLNGLSPDKCHYLNQCWLIFNWPLRKKSKWHWNKNTRLFIKPKYIKVFCKMSAILFQLQVSQESPRDVPYFWQLHLFCWIGKSIIQQSVLPFSAVTIVEAIYHLDRGYKALFRLIHNSQPGSCQPMCDLLVWIYILGISEKTHWILGRIHIVGWCGWRELVSFFKGHWQSLAQSLWQANCLPLGLCKGLWNSLHTFKTPLVTSRFLYVLSKQLMT